MPDSGNYERKYFMNKTMKKIVAAGATAVTMISTTLSASAENVAKNWMALFYTSAPASVNKVYIYEDVPAYGHGYIVDCTHFEGGYDALVDVTTPGNATFRFTNTGTYRSIIPYSTDYGKLVTFKFSALRSTTNCNASGRILYNM